MSAPQLEPGSGVIGEDAHYFPVRVYYEDTDAGGIVYHAGYLRFAERARSEFLRMLGWQHDRMVAETGHFWVVRRAEIDFKRPAKLDDALMVVTRLTAMRAASLYAAQTIQRAGADLVQIRLELVLLGPAGRPGRIPAVLSAALRPYLKAAESVSSS